MKKRLQILFVLVFLFVYAKAQNYHNIWLGLNIPDKNTSNFLSTGYSLAYGVDIKLYQNLYLNTDLSVSFNNKNSEYRYGFDDNERLNENSQLKDVLLEFYLPALDNFNISLFNTSLQLNIQYVFLHEKNFSSYIKAGVSLNYSMLEDYYYEFSFTDENNLPEATFIGDDCNTFNVGYNAELGLTYKFIFIAFNYSVMPSVKMGSPDTSVAFYSLKLGTKFLFSKYKE